MLEIILICITVLIIHFKYRRNMVDLLHNLQGVYAKWESRGNAMVSGGSSHGREHQPTTSGNGTFERNNYANNLGGGPLHGGNGHGVGRMLPGRRISFDRRKMSTGSRNLSLPSLRDMGQHQVISDELSRFKISPTARPDNLMVRPFMGNVCTKCSSYRTNPFDEVKALGLSNILRVSTANSDRGFLTRKFHHLANVWVKKADFFYPNVTKNILNCERVKIAIENAATRDLEDLGLEPSQFSELVRKHADRAAKVLKIMKADISTRLIRFTAWVLFKVLGRLLTSVQIHKGQLEILKKYGKRNVPIIYLPLHRSHLDYILVTFILFLQEIKAPLVAAGDNLKIPIFSPIMRGLGAYFIKRKLDPKDGKRDFVYRAVLHNYMVENLSAGHSMEFFIEGGRSRSGKACLPKGGLLSIVVNALLDGAVEDAYVVPVGISYEKLLDGSFISEQMGNPKVKESLSSVLKGIWNVMRANYGSVRVDFAHPFSLREFVHAAQSYVPSKPRLLVESPDNTPANILRSVSSTASLYGTDVVIEDQRLLVKGLAEHALYDAVNSTALMSTNLVAFLLMNKYRQGVLLRSLTRDFEWLCTEIRKRGRDVGFTGDSSVVVRHAVKLLGTDLVSRETNSDEDFDNLTFIKPVLTVPQVLALSYYSNVTLSVFLKDAILACALTVLIGEDLDTLKDVHREVTVSKQQLLDKALDLCDIFQYEFILSPPCSTLESFMNDSIEEFITAEILSREQPEDDGTNWSRRMTRRMEWEDEDEEGDAFAIDHQRLKVNLSSECLESLQLFRNILAPFLEGYWQLGNCLHNLIKTEMEENEFVRSIQRTTLKKIDRGLVEFGECVAADILRNGLRLFANWRVVESSLQDTVKVIFLADHFNNEQYINEVLGILNEFRR